MAAASIETNLMTMKHLTSIAILIQHTALLTKFGLATPPWSLKGLVLARATMNTNRMFTCLLVMM